MDIRQSPFVGVQKFGVIYKQQSGGDGFAEIVGISVKLKILQRIKIFLKSILIKIREKIYA
jgi:hypothetical protein